MTKKKQKEAKRKCCLQASVDVSHVVTHHSTQSPQRRLTSQFGMGYGAFVVVWTLVIYHPPPSSWRGFILYFVAWFKISKFPNPPFLAFLAFVSFLPTQHPKYKNICIFHPHFADQSSAPINLTTIPMWYTSYQSSHELFVTSVHHLSVESNSSFHFGLIFTIQVCAFAVALEWHDVIGCHATWICVL